MEELQTVLDEFRDHYNTVRPYRALNRHTPEFAYQPIPKAAPVTIDHDGKISLRHSGRMLHLGIGRTHNRQEVICLIHNNDATVMLDNGDILAEFPLNPDQGYQRKNG